MKKKLKMVGLLGILGLVSLAAWGPSLGQKEKPEPEVPQSIAEMREFWRRAEAGDPRAREFLSNAWEGYQRLKAGGPRWDPLAELSKEGEVGAESKAMLARRYRLGVGVEQDFAAARRLAFEALEEGAYGVYTDLGELYLAGQGVPESAEEAVRLFEEGARRDVPSSYRRLGDVYLEGIGVEADAGKAADAYRRAAELGDSPAALAIGKLYVLGEWAEQDPGEVTGWYRQAADAGLAEALYYLGASVLDLVDQDAEGLELEEEQLELVVELLHRAAVQGHQEAAMALNLRYAEGRLGPRRRYELTWWPGSMADLEDGKFVTNIVAATAAMDECGSDCSEVLEMGVAMGDPRAGLNLGLQYARGKGADRSALRAIRHFRNAAAKGLPEAMNELGACYAAGQGVGEDLEKAAEWYRKAAEAGDRIGAFNLGLMYFRGEGLEQDIMGEGRRWMELAATEGDAVAVAMRDALIQLAEMEAEEEAAAGE
ncbi:MAG: tetratricopeptide repeat protein [Thermoanaerobaculia bacterium]